MGGLSILDVEHVLGIDVAEFRSGMRLEPGGVRLGEDLHRLRIDDLDRLDSPRRRRRWRRSPDRRPTPR